MKSLQLLLSAFITGALSQLNAANIHVPGDYNSISNAIKNAVRGDVILVSPGSYKERLIFKPNITVRSLGGDEKGKVGLKRAELTVIDGSGGQADRPGVTMAEGATLDGFTITGVGSYSEEKWQKAWNEKGENQSHEHIGKFGVPGIAITAVNCRVVRNIVHHIGNTGIAIRGATRTRTTPLISENVCYRNMGGGIGSMMGSTAIIENNHCFENYYAGIGHNKASPILRENICYRNIRAGIGISEGSSPLLRGNRCYRNRRAGIGIRTGSDTRPIVEDNDCYENEMAGIGCDEEASPIIRGNRCYRNKLAGIGVRSNSVAYILENHSHENGTAGVGLNTAGAVIVRNQIEKNKTAGIGISGKSKASVIENTCRENRLVAVGIPNDGEAFLEGNTLERTGGMPPIIAILNDSNAVLVNNTIKGGGIAGVMLSGRLEAIDNTIEGQNGAHGILARENSEATLSGNIINGYRKKVSNQGAQSVTETQKSSLE
ncbi:MAG: right-handed parallel beta-helix repeat-containing protein [Akkermansiaceae bacterium]